MKDKLLQYKFPVLIILLIIIIVSIFIYIQYSYRQETYIAINISIKGNMPYIQSTDIQNIISQGGRYAITKIPIPFVNLHTIETNIAKNPWVDKIHVYADVHKVLHIEITECEPVMRIISTDNKTFYVDANAKHIPLSIYCSANVPVCDNYPSSLTANKDKELLAYLLDLLGVISNDVYLSNHISYMNIVDTGYIEIIPRTGTPVARISVKAQKEKIMNILKNFYLQVLPNVGWQYYQYIDLRFDNEIIALKK